MYVLYDRHLPQECVCVNGDDHHRPGRQRGGGDGTPQITSFSARQSIDVLCMSSLITSFNETLSAIFHARLSPFISMFDVTFGEHHQDTLGRLILLLLGFEVLKFSK